MHLENSIWNNTSFLWYYYAWFLYSPKESKETSYVHQKIPNASQFYPSNVIQFILLGILAVTNKVLFKLFTDCRCTIVIKLWKIFFQDLHSVVLSFFKNPRVMLQRFPPTHYIKVIDVLIFNKIIWNYFTKVNNRFLFYLLKFDRL